MTPQVRLHQLEGFYHVCTHGSFARAVEALPYPVTESALHQQVRKLEASLDVSLLVRGARRRMHPTPEGRKLYAFVESYFAGLPATLSGISEREAILTLGVEPLYVNELCAPALEVLHREQPHVKLQLRELDGREVAEAVHRGTLDCGLSSELAVLPAGVAFHPLGHLELTLLAPEDHPLARKRKITRDHLADDAFLLYSTGTEAREYTEAMARALGIELRVAAEADSALTLRALVRAGVGPAFVPSLARSKVRSSRDGLVEHTITNLIETAGSLPRYGLHYRADLEEHPLIKALVQALETMRS